MDKRKFFKKLDKNLGMTKIRNQIRAISSLFVFLVIGAAFAIYMNHNGIWLSYGIIIAAASMIVLALFMSYRIKLKVRLGNMKLDYRERIVTPFAREYFEDGYFSKIGSLTEREIIATNMFSSAKDYEYSSCNELKGKHKSVKFSNSDVFEDCYPSEYHVHGKFFEFDIETPNLNPVIFTTSTAPILECQNPQVKLVKPHNDVIDRMFRVYAFDENEVNALLTDNMVYKLRQLVGLQLGRIVKIGFQNGKTYMYFTTEESTYAEEFTKKNSLELELKKIREKFNVIGKIIDIL